MTDALYPPSARRLSLSGIGLLLVLPAAWVALWYVLSKVVFVVPAPEAALRSLGAQLATSQYRSNIVGTAGKILAAFGVSAILGIALGALLGLVTPLRRAFEPLVLIANGIPKIVLYPILLILFGLGSASQITMGVLFGTLPVLVNLMAALASMPAVYRKVARMLEVGPLRAFFSICIPAVAPMLMVALRLGFSLSVLGVVYSELIASRTGLGQEVIQTYSVGKYDRMTASVLVILAISLGGVGLLHLIERLVIRHR
jgi:NitT/TauT family transport system permease protein